VRMVVIVIMVAIIMIVPVIAAAHVMVMRLLRGPDLILIADDLRAVFTELAVHVRLAAVDLRDTFDKSGDDQSMVAQIRRLDEADPRKAGRRLIRLRINALHQDAREQKIRKHDNPPEAESRGAVERRVDARMRDAAI